MNTIRQNKVARLVQKELAIIFQENSHKLFDGKLISVTNIRISPDLSLCKVYLSIFPYNEKENYIDYINKQKKAIRNLLGRRISHIKNIPDLIFFRDDSAEFLEKMDDLLKK